MNSTPSESPPIEFEVRCPVSGATLRIVRTFVEAVAFEVGFDRERVAQIEMAVDEACANVWLHAYPDEEAGGDLPGTEKDRQESCQGGGSRELVLRLRLDGRAICISVIDYGVGNRQGPHRGIRSVREYCGRETGFRGLGTYIMRSFMDEVEFDYPEPNGTVVRMTKYLDIERVNS